MLQKTLSMKKSWSSLLLIACCMLPERLFAYANCLELFKSSTTAMTVTTVKKSNLPTVYSSSPQSIDPSAVFELPK